MSVKLSNKIKPKIIHVSQMQDGQIGEIVSWSVSGYENAIVQKMFPHYLFAIGHPTSCWENIQNITIKTYPDCKVRLLKPGEYIEIVQN
jgi:hypothetical protein